jgi:flagellar biosynthesis protein FlhF
MKIKRFFAKDMRSALNEVKHELGPDAVIMSNKRMADGVEIVAAVDYEKTNKPVETRSTPPVSQEKTRLTNNFVRPKPATAKPESEAAVADSLSALLERQASKSTTAQSTLDTAVKKPTDWFKQEFEDDLNLTHTQAQSLSPNDAQPIHAQSEHHESQMQAMRDEMASMRQLLEHQLSGLRSEDMARKDPTRALLLDRLKGMGICESLADQLACFLPDDVSTGQAWQETLTMLSKQVSTADNEILRRGGVFALVGPTGVGKTTTVAKLAALGAQKFGANNVALITTDSYRIGAFEQLNTYGKIIGCPVKQVKSAEELTEILYHLRNKRLVLIDTAGMSQRDLRLTEQLNTLMRNSRVDIRSYLVLSATAQLEVQQEAIKQFKQVQLSGCIFTKLDECLSLGEIISVAIQNRLPIGYLTNGQRVPEDIRVANAEKLVSKANQLYTQRKNSHTRSASSMAHQAVGMYD